MLKCFKCCLPNSKVMFRISQPYTPQDYCFFRLLSINVIKDVNIVHRGVR